MKPVNLLLVPLLCSFISCVPTQEINWDNSMEIAHEIKMEYDEFEKVTRYLGPAYDGNTSSEGDVRLRAWKFDSHESVSFQIYVRTYYFGNWRFYERAYDSDGKKLDTIVIGREIDDCFGSTCLLIEKIGINVNTEYLKIHESSGIRFKIVGLAGEDIFSIPPTYITAFLMLTIEDVNASMRPSALVKHGWDHRDIVFILLN